MAEKITTEQGFAVCSPQRKEQDIWKFSLLTASGKDNMKQIFANSFGRQKRKIEYPFIVYDKRKNSYAGSTIFYDICQITKRCSWVLHGTESNFRERDLIKIASTYCYSLPLSNGKWKGSSLELIMKMQEVLPQ